MGNITRRKDGTYQAQSTITVNGKKKQKYFYGKTPSEVKRKMVAYKGEVAKGRLFTVVADEWQEEHDNEITNGTRMSYNPAVKKSKEEFKGIYINTITPNDINRFIVSESKKGYSAQTIRVLLSTLNQIFNHAILQGDVENNPTTSVKPPKNLPKQNRELPDSLDIEKIKNSVSLKFGLFAYLLLYTGCRRSEALALTDKDIDFEAKVIRINKSLHFVNSKAVLKHTTKTKSSTREIILLDRLAEYIPRKKGFLFFDSLDSFTEMKYRRLWNDYCKEAGLQKPSKKDENIFENSITPHQLRHAYATILFEAGVEEKDAQELLGHSKISITKDVYTHIRKTRKSKTAELLNKFDG